MRSRAAKRGCMQMKESLQFYTWKREKYKTESADSGNIEGSENLLTSPIKEKNESTKT